MFRNPLIAIGFALTLGLTACAPPADEPKAEEETAAEAAAANEEAAAPAPAAEEAPAPAPKPKPRPVAEATPPPPPPVCNDCGVVASIEPVKEKGSGSGAGAVLGAIAGGVIGHQFGSGRGNDAATAGGAVVGGLAGHEAEKRIRATSYYKVGVNMENGTYQTVNVADASGISAGAKVRVVGGNIQLR